MGCRLHKGRRDQHRPFFLYLAYNAPHTPIQPPEEWVDRVKEREKGMDEKRAKLVALIEHLDDGIGKVIESLSETGLSEDTLVIFTSDNGGQLNVGASNGPLSGGKGQMLEGGIREPMCAVWPERVSPGSLYEGAAMTMDLFPTICEVAGVSVDHKIDGKSLLPAITGNSTWEDYERYLFWVRREGGIRYGGRAFYAARYGDFKLEHNNPFEPLKLYNLADDPLEENPLAVGCDEYRMLFNALQDHVMKTGAVPWQRYPVKL
jgi:arylsulfatase A-like enzyme